MENLSLALRAVTAVTMAAKRFRRSQSVYPQNLFQCIMKTLNNVEKKQLTFCLDDYAIDWNFSETGCGEIVLQIQPNNPIIYEVNITVDKFQHTLEWRPEDLVKLDVMIINAIRRCIAARVIDLSGVVEVEQKLHLTELAKKGILEFHSTELTPAWKADLSAKGVEVKVIKYGNPTEKTFIPWDQIVIWLE